MRDELRLKDFDLVHLLDCPCCGGKAKVFEKQVPGGPERYNALGVTCTECSLQVSKESYAGCNVIERMEESIKRWNSRV